MFDFLKNISRKQLELAISAVVILVAVGGAGLFTYYLFMQDQEAKIAIKGGSLGASKGGGGKEGASGSGSSSGSAHGGGGAAGGGSGAGEGTGDGTPPPPDPLADKSPAEQRSTAANEAAARGDHRAALTFYQAALADDPDNPAYLKGAGEAALKSGEYDLAEAFLRKAVARHRQDGGKEGDDQSVALANNLSRTLLARGSAAEAEKVIARSVAAQERNGKRFGESMASWAEAANAAGKPDVAMQAAKEGAGFYKAKDPLNPHYMRLLQLTAVVAEEKEEYVAAMNAIKEELVATERKEGRESEGVAQVLSRWGLLSYRRKEYGDAHQRLTDALEIARRVYPAGSELESETLRRLAMVDETLYPGQVAEKLLREAYRLDQRIHGPSHRRTAESSVLLARYLTGAGQYKEAEDRYVEAIGIWQEGTVDDLTAAGWLITFGDLLEKMGRGKEAAEMRGLSHDIGKRAQGR